MDFLRRHRIVLAIGLLACVVLLGRWAMFREDVAPASVSVERVTRVEASPAQASAPATASPVPDVTPPAPDPASSFGTFRGRVIDAVTREPVREFEVEFHGMRSTKAGAEIPGAQTFRTDDGRFEWQYALAGRWLVTVSAQGYQRFELNDLRIEGGVTTQEVVMPLRSGHRLSGRVFEEATGTGIAAANISFREAGVGRYDGNWRSRSNTTTGKNGSFALEGVPAGRMTLMVYAQAHASRELDVVVGEKTSPLEIGLVTGGAITGYLATADGRTPIAGHVGLSSLDEGYGGTSPTGDAGEFSFQHLKAGRYRLSGQASGGTAEKDIMLGANERVDGIVLALGAGHSIRGNVTGLRADDLQRLGISVHREGEALANPYAEVHVDANGAYLLQGVAPGRMRVVADVSSRRQLSKVVQMPADADLTVNLDFPRGVRLSGRVTRAGKPIVGAWLEPRPLVEQENFYIYGASTSNTGEYAIEDLTAGEYSVAIGNYRSRTVQVTADTVFDIDIPGVHLAGRVLEESGKVPIVGAEVEIWPAQASSPRIRLYDDTDHFGDFALVGLEPGDFILTAYKPGYEMYRERFSYGSPTSGMTVRLRRAKGVEISVREAGSGKPLRNVFAIEMVGEHNGSRLHLTLDESGVGYLPLALVGSRLVFSEYGYDPTEVRWSGEGLELQLRRQKNR